MEMERMKLCKVSCVQICCAALFIAFACGAGNAKETMEMIWSESDGLRHEIFTSSYEDGVWQDPVQITDDNANNLHPSIGVDSSGKKWAVWTAMEGSSVEVRYSVYEGDTWSDVQTLPSTLSSNIKPSLIVDDSDVPWVVWTGNSDDDDDIYFMLYKNGEWTEEARVHSDNDVPDILPFIDTDDENRPVVTWQRYQSEEGYVQVQSIWQDGAWSEPELVEVAEETEEEEDEQVVIPQFVGDTRQVFLRALPSSEKK